MAPLWSTHVNPTQWREHGILIHLGLSQCYSGYCYTFQWSNDTIRDPQDCRSRGGKGVIPPQILTEQLTLSQPGGISCPPNYCLPPGFSDLPTIRDPNAPFAKYTHVCFSKTPCSIAIFAWADLHYHIIIIHYILSNFPGPELKNISCYFHFLNPAIPTSERYFWFCFYKLRHL